MNENRIKRDKRRKPTSSAESDTDQEEVEELEPDEEELEGSRRGLWGRDFNRGEGEDPALPRRLRLTDLPLSRTGGGGRSWADLQLSAGGWGGA